MKVCYTTVYVQILINTVQNRVTQAGDEAQRWNVCQACMRSWVQSPALKTKTFLWTSKMHLLLSTTAQSTLGVIRQKERNDSSKPQSILWPSYPCWPTCTHAYYILNEYNYKNLQYILEKTQIVQQCVLNYLKKNHISHIISVFINISKNSHDEGKEKGRNLENEKQSLESF